jgi:hypothetical protein
MAVKPLNIPQIAVDPGIDFSPLAKLGQIGQPQDNTLAGLGKVYGATANAAPVPASAQWSPTGDMAEYARRISRNESGGRYDLVGDPIPKTGDRAYGKYQVMGANIPEWTQAALGRSMTPQEFLASPDAQEKVFAHRFGSYVDKYGPEGAAKAWFAGEGGMNNPAATDPLGTSVSEYARRFNAPLTGEQ